MFKKRELLFLGLFGLSAFNVAEAKSDFFDKFYVRGNAYFGYNYNMANSISSVGYHLELIGNEQFETKSILRHSPIVGVGVNLYFKISKRLDLLAGVDITGRMPVGTKTKGLIERQYKGSFSKENYSFEEYAKLNAKLGVKVNFNKSFAVESYGLAGINVARLDTSFSYGFDDVVTLSAQKERIDIGTVFGGGVNLVIKDRYTVGVEYYNSCNITTMMTNFKQQDIAPGVKTKLNIHNVLVKFGVQF